MTLNRPTPTVLISEQQRDFLLRNSHLYVCGNITGNVLVVKDMGMLNDFKQHPVYILTPDCKVQDMATYYEHATAIVQTIIL